MPRMKVVQVAKPNANLEVVERDIPEPNPRQVRIRSVGLWPGRLVTSKSQVVAVIVDNTTVSLYS